MISIPVHVWLPGCADPSCAGVLEVDDRNVSFTYGAEYLTAGGPSIVGELPARRARHRQNSSLLFPIMQDAGPDSWGEMLLEKLLQHQPTQLELLTLCRADGAGNLVLGALTPDRFETIEIETFIHILNQFEDPAQTDPAYVRLREIIKAAIDQGTGLGGAKPKLELSDGGVRYIAKFPDIHDDPYLPHVESAMLKLASQCGIQVAAAQVKEVGDHRHPYCLISKRFDREQLASGGIGRIGYASAHCVNRVEEATHQSSANELTEFTLRGYSSVQLAKSYPRFAENMKRWCVDREAWYADVRELWRRIVFNALVRNTDDHTKNHGLLCRDMATQHWRLSPAFDIVCSISDLASPALCMPYLYQRAVRHGRTPQVAKLVTKANRQDLIQAATLHYCYEQDEAAEVFESMRQIVRTGWRERMEAEGMPDAAISRYEHNLDRDIAETWEESD